MGRYRVVQFGQTSDESVLSYYESEQEARAAFTALDPAVPASLSVEDASRASGWRRIGGGWTRLKNGLLAHLTCIENHNEAVACGIDRGGCYHPRCALRMT